MSKLVKKVLLVFTLFSVVLGVRPDKAIAKTEPVLIKNGKNIGKGYTLYPDVWDIQNQAKVKKHIIKKGGYTVLFDTGKSNKADNTHGEIITEVRVTDKKGKTIYNEKGEFVNEAIIGKNNLYYTAGDTGKCVLYKIDFKKGIRKKLTGGDDWGFVFGLNGEIYFTEDSLILKNESGDGDAGGYSVKLKTDSIKKYRYLTSNEGKIYYALLKGKYLKIYRADLDFSNEKYMGKVKNFDMSGLYKVKNNYLYYYSSSGETAKIKLNGK